MKGAPGRGTSRAPRVARACGVLLAGAALLYGVTSVTGVGWTIAVAIVAGAFGAPAALDLLAPLLPGGRKRDSLTRIAIIGDAGAARRLRYDLERGRRRYEFVGRISMPGDYSSPSTVLTELGGVRRALIDHRIQLLVLSPSASRALVFDELVASCLDLPVQLVELSRFYEAVFGYVPVSEMNAAWFQYLLDPSSRFPHPLAKRAIDVIGALVLGLPALPVCGLLILWIRRDGGPGLYRQTRIGEGGRPFVLYKLRTMQPSSATSAQWAAVDDPRVTRIGRFLRRTYIDEVPQLLNVLRGEMSLVGPRPEQPAFVERLEREIPYYQRRHLIRPGISGWAQVRTGYARSDAGSVWKHCHDLFYLKHRSIGLDLRILARTAWLIARSSFRLTRESTSPAVPAEHSPPRPIEPFTPPAKPAVPDTASLMLGGSPPSSR